MLLGVLKTDHTNLSLVEREQVYFSDSDKDRFLSLWRTESPVDELVIMSTCNRSEIYFSGADLTASEQRLKRLMSAFFGVSSDWIDQKFESIRGDAALKHLFGVISGIHSMVFGENEILGQVKAAYQFCLEKGSTQSILNKAFQSAIAVGKRVRDETELGKGAYSVSSIAIDRAAQIRPDFLKLRTIIVGAGDTSLRCVKKLAALGHQNLVITNRTPERAGQIAAEYGLETLDYAQLISRLNEFDCVFVATLSPDYLVFPAQIASNRPKVVVDLGVPRNVDPRVAELPNVTLITIDHLTEIADENVARRRVELPKINGIFDEEIAIFHQWHNYRRLVSV